MQPFHALAHRSRFKQLDTISCLKEHSMKLKAARNTLSTCLRMAGVALLAVPSMAGATFSIVACDRNGDCGVAVATNNLAVGATVPYAQAKVGALVSQFETNP